MTEPVEAQRFPPPGVASLEFKPGRIWTPEEFAICRVWLISEKWRDLSRVVEEVIPQSAADHRAGVIAEFLAEELDLVLKSYKPGFSGIWAYVAVCLRRYCWQASKALVAESGRTLAIGGANDGPEPPDANGPPAGGIPKGLLYKELHSLLQREIGALKPEYREPLLRKIRGAPYQEIASDLGISVNLAKVRVFRARHTIKKVIEATWPGFSLRLNP
jgi:DNA-directed RNA polymerase specialized sigma24 family protein